MDAGAFGGRVLSAVVTAIDDGHAAVEAAIRLAGKAVGCWTIDAEADLRRVIGLGVDTVITDDPHLPRQVADGVRGPVTP